MNTESQNIEYKESWRDEYEVTPKSWTQNKILGIRKYDH